MFLSREIFEWMEDHREWEEYEGVRLLNRRVEEAEELDKQEWWEAACETLGVPSGETENLEAYLKWMENDVDESEKLDKKLKAIRATKREKLNFS